MKRKIFVILALVFMILIIVLLYFLNNNKEKRDVCLIKIDDEFELITPEYVEDTYILNINEDKVKFLANNVVEAVDIVPTTDYTIKINN